MRYFETTTESFLNMKDPDFMGIQIPGRYGKIYSTYYIAKGEGLHPTIILCHGFPGHDKLIDLAQAFRSYGYNVMTFSYSGSWGSGGPYAFRHCIKDTDAVLDFILDNFKLLKANPEKIGILGHSIGGFVATHVYASRPELKACTLVAPCDLGEVAVVSRADDFVKNDLIRIMKLGASWLKGTTGELLYGEIVENADAYRLSTVANKVYGRPILFVEAGKENTAPVDINIYPFLNTLLNIQKYSPLAATSTPEHVILDTDHYFSDMRKELFEAAYSFFKKNL